jgi:excisionase family DNA binding protein
MARPSHIGQAAEKRTMACTADKRGSALIRRRAMSARTPDAEPLLTPAEVATMFRVDPKTVTRWAKAGKLTSIRTLGGHRRYRESEVRALLAGIPSQRAEG